MFRGFRQLLLVLQELTRSLQSLVGLVSDTLERGGSASGTEELLEGLRRDLDKERLDRAMWQAEVEGLVQRAEGQYAAARNAEERSRTMMKAAVGNEKAAEGDAEGAEDLTPEEYYVSPGNDGAGGAEGVQPLPMGVAWDAKELALRQKFAGRP